MKVLVVGGAGYIGGAVTDALIRKDIPFTVYDRLLYESLYLKPVDFIYGDIRDTQKLTEILPGYTHVIWLAAIVGDPACKINAGLTTALNQEAPQWLSENYKGRIIFMSTCSVYGKNNDLLDEEAPTNPLSLYAETKLKAESYFKDKNCLIFRLGTVFGIADAFARIRMDLAVNYMTANALQKGQLSIFGGNQWRPFLHVKDVGDVIVNNLESQAIGIYNLSALNTQMKDLGMLIGSITHCKVVQTDMKFQDERNYHVSNEKSIRDGVFNPTTARTIEDGVQEIIDLIQSHRIKYTEDDVYFNERHITNLLKSNELS